ncbi:MAG: hypothetical protein ACK56F_17465 [bacterium]
MNLANWCERTTNKPCSTSSQSVPHILTAESLFLPNTDNTLQDDISPKMRFILVDWLVELHHKLELMGVTLHLCVNLIDRYYI